MSAAVPTSSDLRTTDAAKSFHGHFRKNSNAHLNIWIFFAEELEKSPVRNTNQPMGNSEPGKGEPKACGKYVLCYWLLQIIESDNQWIELIMNESTMKYLKDVGKISHKILGKALSKIESIFFSHDDSLQMQIVHRWLYSKNKYVGLSQSIEISAQVSFLL